MWQVAGRTSHRRILCYLEGTLGGSVGIYRAAIPVTPVVSWQLREMRKAPSSVRQGAGCPGTGSGNDPVGRSHLGPVGRYWTE